MGVKHFEVVKHGRMSTNNGPRTKLGYDNGIGSRLASSFANLDIQQNDEPA